MCLCEFEDTEEVRSTFCKHIFHSKCLTDWMNKNEVTRLIRECTLYLKIFVVVIDHGESELSVL